MDAYLPDTLLVKDESGKPKEVPRDSILKGKHVILYFSAHWCPPCQKFTPQLAEWYMMNSTKKNIEVVFVSSDKSQGEFDRYYASMPWAAMPFRARAEKHALSAKLEVRGIPSAKLFSPAGELLHPSVNGYIKRDPRALKFPYIKMSVKESFTAVSKLPLKAADGAPTTVAEVFAAGAPLVALYFSASWCPPCQRFTPKFATAYERLNKAGKKFEAVYLPADHDEASYNAYRKKMPFLAASYDDVERISKIFQGLDLEGYPTCMIIDKDFKVVHANAVGRFITNPDEFPFPPKPVEDAEVALVTVNELPTVLAFTDKCTSGEVEDKVKEAMNTVAKDFFVGEGKEADSPFKFGMITEDFDQVDAIRDFFGLNKTPQDVMDGDEHVRIVLVSIPTGKKFYIPGRGALTADEIRGLIARFAVNEGGVGIRTPAI